MTKYRPVQPAADAGVLERLRFYHDNSVGVVVSATAADGTLVASIPGRISEWSFVDMGAGVKLVTVCLQCYVQRTLCQARLTAAEHRLHVLELE